MDKKLRELERKALHDDNALRQFQQQMLRRGSDYINRYFSKELNELASRILDLAFYIPAFPDLFEGYVPDFSKRKDRKFIEKGFPFIYRRAINDGKLDLSDERYIERVRRSYQSLFHTNYGEMMTNAKYWTLLREERSIPYQTGNYRRLQSPTIEGLDFIKGQVEKEDGKFYFIFSTRFNVYKGLGFSYIEEGANITYRKNFIYEKNLAGHFYERAEVESDGYFHSPFKVIAKYGEEEFGPGSQTRHPAGPDIVKINVAVSHLAQPFTYKIHQPGDYNRELIKHSFPYLWKRLLKIKYG